MLLDTDVPIGLLYPDGNRFRAAMVDVAQHAQDRGASAQWASRLRLLAPNPDLQLPDYEWPEDVVKETHRISGEASLADAEAGSPAPDPEELCACDDFYERSRLLRPSETALMVTEPGEIPDCVHYVAISYCWQSWAEALNSKRCYSVRRKGSLTPPKCPSLLMNWAVEFTHLKGLRLFWIDQECIDQYDPYDKSTGIQAMDLVYEQAEYSVAILATTVKEQRHLDAINSLLTVYDSEHDLDVSTLGDLIEILELIVADPWFERAWTLQESTSGARQMTLLIGCGDSLEGTLRSECYEHDLHFFELELPELHIQISSSLTVRVEELPAADQELRMRCNAFLDAWSRIMPPDVNADYDDRERTACDAADALWYMQRRMNSVVADRLAILANLCAYDIRLDTKSLDKLGFDFSICAMTLAVLNGDLTLMAGLGSLEHGDVGKLGQFLSAFRESSLGGAGHGFTWSLPSSIALDDLPCRDKDTGFLTFEVATPVSLQHGLAIYGCLWVVDHAVDCQAIRDSFLHEHPDLNVEQGLLVDSWNPRDPFGASTIRVAKVNAVTRLLCHLSEAGYAGLVLHFWRRLRVRATKKQLEGSPDVRDYCERAFEEIVNVNSRKVKWKSPMVPYDIPRAYRPDPFQYLDGAFVRHLLMAVFVRGHLPVGRLTNAGRSKEEYTAFFDEAAVGDSYFTPCSNPGGESFDASSPDHEFVWYPMAWGIAHASAATPDSVLSISCQSLVCGSWTADNSAAQVVNLV